VIKRRTLFANESDMRKYIGAQIKDARENASLSRQELSDLISSSYSRSNLGTSSIGAIEEGKQTPSMWTVCRICDICEITPDQLLGIPEMSYTNTRNLLIAWAYMDSEQKRHFLEYGRQISGIEVAL